MRSHVHERVTDGDLQGAIRGCIFQNVNEIRVGHDEGGFPQPLFPRTHLDNKIVNVDRQQHPRIFRAKQVPIQGPRLVPGGEVLIAIRGRFVNRFLKGEASRRAVVVGPVGAFLEFLEHKFLQSCSQIRARKPPELDFLAAAHDAARLAADGEVSEESLGAVGEAVGILQVQRKELQLRVLLPVPAFDLNAFLDRLL